MSLNNVVKICRYHLLLINGCSKLLFNIVVENGRYALSFKACQCCCYFQKPSIYFNKTRIFVVSAALDALQVLVLRGRGASLKGTASATPSRRWASRSWGTSRTRRRTPSSAASRGSTSTRTVERKNPGVGRPQPACQPPGGNDSHFGVAISLYSG